MICCGYLVGQFDGELVDGMTIKINMGFIGAPDKYLVQAIDTKQNRFSIKTSKTFSQHDNKLIFDFNGMLALYNAVGNGGDGIFQLSIKFEFKGNNLYKYRYHYQDLLLLLPNIHNNTNVSNSNNNNEDKQMKSSDWPNTGDLHKLINKTRIWLGYSNNNADQIINNYKNITYTNQYNNIIIGCIHHIIVYNRRIELEKKGKIDNFYKYCRRGNDEVIESICSEHESCRNRTIRGRSRRYDSIDLDYKRDFILECSNEWGVEMNTANHCFPDLSKTDVNFLKSIIVKLVRFTKESINQSLVKMITRNNSLLNIYFNSFHQIILKINHDKSINSSKYILYKISSNQIHILRIEFTESNSTFQVSNGDFIQTLILPKLEFLNLTKNGHDFEEKIPEQVYNWKIILIVTISVSCLILICIALIIDRIKKERRNVRTSNIYEEQTKMNNLK